MSATYYNPEPRQVQLQNGLFRERYELNRAYLVSLKSENLLQNYYLEAGIGNFKHIRNTSQGHIRNGKISNGDERHWGWESPTSQVRGHFLGHWLSAATRAYATTGDLELKYKADEIVGELWRCQEENGGEWVFSIPEKYLARIAAGKPTWAPHYTIHKTLMGLVDAYKYAESEQALTILKRATNWFYRWTNQFSREQLDNILDFETGGILEVWADLYAITGEAVYLELLDRYTRYRLFDKLLEGKDVLTNMHANTTIPEILGAARAYEVTGQAHWLEIVQAYWKCAVEDRGYFCTGGQTSGAVWTPPFQLAARRGDKNQEHCTVYNLMRLADFLFRWTGEAKYADYLERNLYNGVLAQQHPFTGLVTYFLPLEGGAQKRWGSPTYDFWCCHGTLVQAHTLHNTYIYYTSASKRELVVAQYISSRLSTEMADTVLKVELKAEEEERPIRAAVDHSSAAGSHHRPTFWMVSLKLSSEKPVEFTLRLRLPWWLQGLPTLLINGIPQAVEVEATGFLSITREWHNDILYLELPKSLTSCPIPDEPETVAFLDGPVVLAGLCEREITLIGDKQQPATILTPDNERHWGEWLAGYRTIGQPYAIRLKPLYQIIDEPYTVYFPVKPLKKEAR